MPSCATHDQTTAAVAELWEQREAWLLLLLLVVVVVVLHVEGRSVEDVHGHRDTSLV